jgi:hypothetical protein
MSIIASLFITWLIILVPPVLLRAVRRTTFSKAWAFVIATGLLVMNHVVFALISGHAGMRPFLTLGAIACFVVLRWETKKSAADWAQANRIANGYDRSPEPQPAFQSAGHAFTPSSGASPPALAASASAPVRSTAVMLQRLNMKRGLLRIWIVLAVAWVALVSFRAAWELQGSSSETLLVDVAQGSDPYDERVVQRLIESWKLRIQGIEPSPKAASASDFYSDVINQVLDVRMQEMERRVRPALSGQMLRADVESALKGIGLSDADIARNPSEASQLALFLWVAERAKTDTVTRVTVFGTAAQDRRLDIGATALASVAPPLIAFVVGLLGLWVAAGFRWSSASRSGAQS